MGFKKLLASLGAGGGSVETGLTEVNVVPGGVGQGEVRVQGGPVNQEPPPEADPDSEPPGSIN